MAENRPVRRSPLRRDLAIVFSALWGWFRQTLRSMFRRPKDAP